MTYEEIINKLKKQSNPKNIEGMARFGINPKNTLGIPIPFLRKLAKEIGKDHRIADKLWRSGIHEARILASMIDEIDKVTSKQMDKWASQFDSWDVCDQVCMNLFDKTPHAFNKAIEWTGQKQEYYKRAGFALMAALAFHDKNAPDSKFEKFFPFIVKEAVDERNFVKKAVNWTLRQIGKRNGKLKKVAIETAEKILKKHSDSKSACWVAKNALRELVTDK
ncbi:MAG: DNA alkylation repair protein [bacterium]|nr:DNA alkylation repair protein [bacterium]